MLERGKIITITITLLLPSCYIIFPSLFSTFLFLPCHLFFFLYLLIFILSPDPGNPFDYYYTVLNPSCNPLSEGLYRGALPSPVKGGGRSPHPLNSELSNFSNLKLKSEEHNKLVCCTFSALRRLYI